MDAVSKFSTTPVHIYRDPYSPALFFFFSFFSFSMQCQHSTPHIDPLPISSYIDLLPAPSRIEFTPCILLYRICSPHFLPSICSPFSPIDLLHPMASSCSEIGDSGEKTHGKHSSSDRSSSEMEIDTLSSGPTEDPELRRLLFLTRLGDYAGRFYNCLRMTATDLGEAWPGSIVQLTNALSTIGAKGDHHVLDLLEKCVSTLQKDGLDADMDMAMVAIPVYAERNAACHSRVGDSEVDNDARARSRVICEDISELSQILPDSQVGNLEVWRRLLYFYRDSHDWRPLGAWTQEYAREQNCPPELRRLGEDFARRAFQDGFFRDDLEPLFRKREDWRPSTPYPSRRNAARSDPIPYLPQKRKAVWPPGFDERPPKRRRGMCQPGVLR
jgi:hypothetical protein